MSASEKCEKLKLADRIIRKVGWESRFVVMGASRTCVAPEPMPKIIHPWLDVESALIFADASAKLGYWLNLQSPRHEQGAMYPGRWCAIAGHNSSNTNGAVVHHSAASIAVSDALYQAIIRRELDGAIKEKAC